MIYFIELWNAKSSWKSLSEEQRSDYMQGVVVKIQTLLDNGAGVTTCSFNDISTSNRAKYEYMAIWNFPNQDAANNFQRVVQDADWYQYFDQINAMGKLDSVENIIGALIQN